MNCTLCGSVQTKAKFTLKNDHQVVYCPNCGVEFLSPQLDDAALDKLYSESYYAAWGIQGDAENETTRQMKKATFQLRLNTIRRFVGAGNISHVSGTSPELSAPQSSTGPGISPRSQASSVIGALSPAKILDIGCATGYFLEVAQTEGFDPYGIEFSEYSAGIAKKKFGDEKIFKGTLEQLQLTDQSAPDDHPDFADRPDPADHTGFAEHSFQVIAMSDLIEHVRVPAETLTRASALLTDDGVIMIMTPDTGTLSNKVMGRKWTHYKLEHFFYFNRKSIKTLAGNCGLKLAYYERSGKALNIDYLHTQLNVYRHWLLTPFINVLHKLLPARLTALNFYFSIGEMVVILRKQTNYKADDRNGNRAEKGSA
jgi:2-polyprenyl-3-methyl-5-hydroxy-6-metoxy-1,4-benzoquinol methylase